MRARGGVSPRGARTTSEPEAHSAGEAAQSAPPPPPGSGLGSGSGIGLGLGLGLAPRGPMAPSCSCSESPGRSVDTGESRRRSSDAVGQLHVAWASRDSEAGARTPPQSESAGSPAG
eukprot:scaffold97128_cov36-Phaeocystis_antarctica.AAC.1